MYDLDHDQMHNGFPTPSSVRDLRARKFGLCGRHTQCKPSRLQSPESCLIMQLSEHALLLSEREYNKRCSGPVFNTVGRLTYVSPWGLRALRGAILPEIRGHSRASGPARGFLLGHDSVMVDRSYFAFALSHPDQLNCFLIALTQDMQTRGRHVVHKS